MYKFDETKMIEAPLPPLSMPAIIEPFDEPPVEVIETVTTKIIENPTPSEYGGRSARRSVAPDSIRSSSEEGERHPRKSISRSVRGGSPSRASHRARSHYREEEEEESVRGLGGAMVVLPERRKSRRERDIKAEIRALEAEKRALKYEEEAREKQEKADRMRESEYEIIENKDRGGVRVEKDRRGRLALVRSTQ